LVTALEGRYRCTIDDKGRIAFPAPFRRALSPEANDTLVLVKAVEPCLYAFPFDIWLKFKSNLLGRPMDYRTRMAVTRLWGMNLKYVTFDKQGRIQIPADFAAHAQLGNEAVVGGAFNRFEIWNPGLLEEALRNSADTFMKQLGEIMDFAV
jgi:MraZ protein